MCGINPNLRYVQVIDEADKVLAPPGGEPPAPSPLQTLFQLPPYHSRPRTPTPSDVQQTGICDPGNTVDLQELQEEGGLTTAHGSVNEYRVAPGKQHADQVMDSHRLDGVDIRSRLLISRCAIVMYVFLPEYKRWTARFDVEFPQQA